VVQLEASLPTDDCSWAVELVEVEVQHEEGTKTVTEAVRTLEHSLLIE
jgi:hypothetical protein